MNSDKLDEYFKERINSLNTVPVPGSKWKPEASWDKIDSEINGRKKIVFWWYLSAVAAIAIIIVGFWFNGIKPSTDINPMAEQSKDNVLKIESKQSRESIILNENVAEKDNLMIEDIANKPIIFNKESENKNQSLNINRQHNIKIDQLAYLPNELSLGESEIHFKTPQLLQSDIKNTANQETEIAFNRTYIIRSKSKEAAQEKNTVTDLILRIDLAMNSEGNPPAGFFSNRGK